MRPHMEELLDVVGYVVDGFVVTAIRQLFSRHLVR